MLGIRDPRASKASTLSPLPRLLLLLLGLLLLIPSNAEARRKKAEDKAGPTEIVWPLPPDEPRIRYVRSFYGEKDFEKKKKGRWKRLFLGPQKDESVGLVKPYGVATDSEGRVYVTDSGLAAVMVFDEGEREVRLIGNSGSFRLKTPIGIAVDARDRIFVSDVGLHQIVGMTPSGEVLMSFGKKEKLNRPAGLAIDMARNRLYASDTPEHRILVYTLDGNYVETWGKRGSGEGEFNYPTNIALAPNGTLFVVDTGNFRIQSFSPDGQFLSAVGEAGGGFGQFTRPKGIGVDSEGHVYVVDAAFNNFQIFNMSGELLLFVGSGGSGPGNFWLPAGLFIDEADRVYVADQANRRVQVFQYLPSSQPEARESESSPEKSNGESPDASAKMRLKGGDEAPTKQSEGPHGL